ncbi:hypothetical protein NKR19_g4677, partial [Coniochaeta hoffmannii]
SILGLLFPPSPAGISPTPVRIPLTTTTDDETSVSFQSVSVASFFPSSSTQNPPDVIYAERNTLRGRDTRSMLEIWTLPSGNNSNEEENGAIKALAEEMRGEGSGEQRQSPFHRWTGPVLALAMTRATGWMVDPGSYRDMTVEDAGDVVDFLLDYENPEHGRRIREALDTLGAEPEGDGGKIDEMVGDGGRVEEGGTTGGEDTRDVVFEVM